MSRKQICLCVAMLFFVGFPAASFAATWWGEIWYAGYVAKVSEQSLCADTLIVLVNPNASTEIEAILIVYDKKGDPIGSTPFLDGGVETRKIPPRGYGWITLSSIVPFSSDTAAPIGKKYTFRIRVGWPDTVKPPSVVRAPVVEVKEILFDSCTANSVWGPTAIKSWSETSLGGDNGTGFYWLPTK